MLYWNTVNEPLRNLLLILMREPLFNPFRLVGGTSLSLQIGHRQSIDIDLFTDAPYGSLNFEAFDDFLRKHYPYVSVPIGPPGIGRSYMVGKQIGNAVKLDLYYTEDFIEPFIEIQEVRFATQKEIIAMKLDVISRGGRKKDFWDIHYFLPNYSFDELKDLYIRRYPYHDAEELRIRLTEFNAVDNDFDPNCVLRKDWDLIKLDFLSYMDELNL